MEGITKVVIQAKWYYKKREQDARGAPRAPPGIPRASPGDPPGIPRGCPGGGRARGAAGGLFWSLATSAPESQHRIAPKSKPKSMEGIAKIAIWV